MKENDNCSWREIDQGSRKPIRDDSMSETREGLMKGIRHAAVKLFWGDLPKAIPDDSIMETCDGLTRGIRHAPVKVIWGDFGKAICDGPTGDGEARNSLMKEIRDGLLTP